MSHQHFGRPWGDPDREILRKHWPKLGNDAVKGMLGTTRTDRGIENEAYRLGLHREFALPKGRRPKSAARNDCKRPNASSFGSIRGGPVASVFDLAGKL